jgi:hypothetical protein
MERQKDPASGSPTADYTTEAVAVAATEAEATTVPGDHESLTGALSPNTRAYMLRLQGHREADIPDLMAMSGQPMTPQEVKDAIEMATKATQESHREDIDIAIELDRLDLIMAGLWPAAVNGDTGAARLVVVIGERRDALLGLRSETARAAFANITSEDGLDDLSPQELEVLTKLAERRAGASKRGAVSGAKSRGGRPNRRTS